MDGGFILKDADLGRAGAATAPTEAASVIVAEGLARRVEDVVILPDGALFTRAYLPSGEPAGFSLRAGRVHS